MPRSTKPDLRLLRRARDEDVARVWVGMKEAVLEDHLDDDPGGRFGQCRSVVPVLLDGLVHLGAGQVLHRQHSLRRCLLVDDGKAGVRVAFEVAREAARVVGFEREVHLGGDRVVELIDERGRLVDVRLDDGALHEACQRVQDLHVPRHGAGDLGTLHLDHDLFGAVGRLQHRAMHLGDGRRRQRLLLEALVDVLERRAERALHRLANFLEGQRIDLVLQLLQLDDPLGRQQVRPGRGDLAQLHERRTEVHGHQSNPLRGGDAALLVLPSLAQRLGDRLFFVLARGELRRRRLAGEAQSLCELGKSVAHENHVDLAQATDVAHGRQQRHHRRVTVDPLSAFSHQLSAFRRGYANQLATWTPPMRSTPAAKRSPAMSVWGVRLRR